MQCSAWSDNSAVILASGRVPLPGTWHPTLGQTCRTLGIKRKKNTRWFDVQAKYSDKPVKPPQDPNPLNRPAAITGSSRQFSIYTMLDRGGNTIANSYGDPYDPIEKDHSRWLYKVSKNIPYNALPAFHQTINDHINSDPFTIDQLGITFDAETLKVQEFDFTDIKSELVPSGSTYFLVNYRTISFGLAFREEGWQYKTPDRGYRGFFTDENGDTFGAYFKEQDSNKVLRPVKHPLYLDGSGHALFGSGQSARPIDPSLIVQNAFDLYDDFDFSDLTPYVT